MDLSTFLMHYSVFAFMTHVCALCVCLQGCDPSSSHPAASAGSDLAVWSVGSSVCCGCICLHRSQCLPGE